MYENIRASRFQIRWNLREVHKVTQWKDGCIYRTKSLGIIACTPEYSDSLRVNNPNIIVGPVSTRVSKLVNA